MRGTRNKCLFLISLLLMSFCLRAFYIDLMSELGFNDKRNELDESEDLSDFLIDKIELDCDGLFQEDKRAIGFYENWIYDHKYHENQLMKAENKCEAILSRFHFIDQPLTIQEANFPLAYGFVVYKNPIQLLFSLSSLYQPQNLYCLAVDGQADENFKEIILSLSECLPNIHMIEIRAISWGDYSIVKAVHACLNWTTNLDHRWKYYQYLSGVDIPLKTNWEMVQIFKALNGTINAEIKGFQSGRLKDNQTDPPLPLYKSSLSALIPRQAADLFVNSIKGKETFEFLKNVAIPDETIWTTLSGNPHVFAVPGGIPADQFIKLQSLVQEEKRKRVEEKGVGYDLPKIIWGSATYDTPRRYYVSRYQIWGRKFCKGKLSASSCVFGINDLSALRKRPELIAHKLYIDYQPAAFFCMLKAHRQQTFKQGPFNAINYTYLPQVEYNRGIPIEKLTNPQFID